MYAVYILYDISATRREHLAILLLLPAASFCQAGVHHFSPHSFADIPGLAWPLPPCQDGMHHLSPHLVCPRLMNFELASAPFECMHRTAYLGFLLVFSRQIIGPLCAGGLVWARA